MTTITRETLELAALAAGHTVYGWYQPTGEGADFADIGPDECVAWAPHTDIADAARLAVRCRFWVRIGYAAVGVVDLDGHLIAQVPHSDADADAERAYCEAVTLGAAHEGRWIRDNRAEIGRRMREGGR